MALNIPTKKTGDQLTATEFNEVVAEVNKKANTIDIPNVSGLPTRSDLALKADKTSVYTREEVNAKIQASSGLVSAIEQEVGVLRYGGKDYAIFEQTFEVSGLPGTAGSSVDAVLNDSPLGGNLYLKVDCFTVAVGTGDKSDFPVSAYTVKRVHVNNEMQTIATIECKEPVTGAANAILTLRYVKGLLSYDTIELSIPLMDLGITSAGDVTVEMPKLKYNKKFAYSYTFDDDVVQAYGKAFRTINKKWVDDEKFFHVGQVKTTGAIPAKTLGYTDGCGNERRFTLGIAIWPNSGNAQIDNFMDPTGKKADKYYPYLVWNDFVPLLDFGSDVYLHNMDERAHDKNDAAQVLLGLRENQSTVFNNLKRKVKILARPDGNNVYVTAGRNFEDIYFIIVENTIDDGSTPLNVNFNTSVDLYKKAQFRRYTEPVANATQLLVKIQEARNSGLYAWMHDFSHAPANFQYILDLLTAINDTYGKNGDDSVWFASVDEVFEYAFARMNSFVSRRVEGGNLIVKTRLARLPLFTKNEFSLVLKKTTALSGTITVSSVVNGLSSKIQADGSLLVNVNFAENLPLMAEKYTSIFESSQAGEDKDDAMYFINMLRAGLQSPYLTRLNAGNVPPVLDTVSINSGATTTSDNNVIVTLGVTGAITGYKISESVDLSTVAWTDGTSKTIQHVLSAILGSKTIHVQVKNANGESGVKTASITLVEQPTSSHVVSARSNNIAFGNVTPASQSVPSGTAATVTATATGGHVIEGWTGADLSTGAGTASGTATINNVKADKLITCNFKATGQGTPAKTVACFNTSVTAPGMNALNLTWAEFQLVASDGSKQITYARGDTIGLTDNKPLVSESFNAIEITGAPYNFEEYKVAAAMYSNTVDESGKKEIHLKAIAGIYRVKLYCNTNNGSTGNSPYRVYRVNGTLQTPSFEVKGNVANYLVFDNVSPVEGRIDIAMWSTKAWVSVVVNVIEIEKL